MGGRSLFGQNVPLSRKIQPSKSNLRGSDSKRQNNRRLEVWFDGKVWGPFSCAHLRQQQSVFAMEAVVSTGARANANMDFILNYPFRGGPATCCGFNQPSFDLVNSFRTNGDGLPLLEKDEAYNAAYNKEENAVKSDMGLLSTQDFTPDTGNLDARLDHAVGRRGIPYWN